MTGRCHHAFSLWLAGGEAPYLRSRLAEGGARHVGVNFMQLRKERMPKSGVWAVEEKFGDFVEVLADGGGHGSTKGVDHEDHLATYIRWAAANARRLAMVIEYDPNGIGLDWVEERRAAYDDLGDLFVPTWHDDHGYDALESLCEVYSRVAITMPSSAVAGRLRQLVARTGVQLHGLAITGPDDLQALPLASAQSTSWISPTKYGETHVFAGGRLHWYPASSKDTVRARHRYDIEQAGFDAEGYLAGDKKVISNYTVWAWAQYEQSLEAQRQAPDAQVVAISRGGGTKRNGQPEGGPVGTTEHPAVSMELVRREPHKTFPGLTHRRVAVEVEGEDGQKRVEYTALPAFAPAGLRRCSSCSLSARCPEFDPAATCTFNFGVEIRTKAQLDSALASALELQFQRVSFARAVEEADGVVINLDLSTELERLLRMTERVKNIQSDTSMFRVEARGQAAGGILSALLAAAGQGNAGPPPPRAPHVPVDSSRAEELLAEIIDAETVD